MKIIIKFVNFFNLLIIFNQSVHVRLSVVIIRQAMVSSIRAQLSPIRSINFEAVYHYYFYTEFKR